MTPTKNRTLAQASVEYQRLTAGRFAVSTNANRKMILGQFVRGVGNLQVRHLQQRHLETYFYDGKTGLTARLAPRSVNLHRTVITGLIRFMQNRGWLTCDPMVNVRPTRVVKHERLRLSAAELLACLDIVNHPRDRMFVALAINTGLRVSEITDLRLQDVNLDAAELTVRIHKSFKEDVFPVNADLDTELRWWLKFYTERVGALQPGYYLCPAKDRPNVHDDTDPHAVALHPLRRMLYPERLKNQIFTQLGLPTKGEGLHTFRRSVARLYYDQMLAESDSADDAIRLTQNLLHHSSLVTTELYLGMAKERTRRDASLKGRPFLTKIRATGDNVVQLEAARGRGEDPRV